MERTRTRAVLGEYRALEDALWREIDSIQRRDRLARATVVAPSAELLRHLKLAAARRYPRGLFGIRFATLFRFALDLAGARVRTFVSSPLFFEELLLQWLRSGRAAAGPLAVGQADTYDVAGAVVAAVRDLRDAAVPTDPTFVIECLRDAATEAGTRLTALDLQKFALLLEAYRYYGERLAAVEVADRAAVFQAAASAGERAEPLLIFGFYDMVQVQADLVAELARHGSVVLFVPAGADAEAWRFGAWFRDTFVPSVTRDVERLAAPPDPPRPEIHNAAGEADEVWHCAKDIRRVLDEGCAAEEIAVVARTLGSYLPHVDAMFETHCIPWTGPPAHHLLDHPLAQAVRLLFRLSLDGFPRGAVLDVVCHPLFRATAGRRHWGPLARRLHIRRGADWERLRRVAGEGTDVFADTGTGTVPPEEVRAFATAVAALLERPWPERAGWAVHAAAHAETLAWAFSEEDASVEERAVVAELRAVLEVLGGHAVLGEAVPRAAFVEAFDRECARRTLGTGPGRGVVVIDAMGLRGLSFRHVFVLGLNARTFPRFMVEEPFISDAVRREVFRSLGHHLAVRMDGYDEERLLFHVVRSAATERCVCIYQRADVKGRLRDPSPFLRPYLPPERAQVPRVPGSDMGKRAAPVVHTPRELVLLAPDVEHALAVFGYDAAAYARGCAMLRALSDPGRVSEFEGVTGPLPEFWDRRARGSIQPTQLEIYGACPFRFFAEHVLGLSIEEGMDGDLTPREIGRLLHAILEAFYREWRDRVERNGVAPAVRAVAARVFADFEAAAGMRLDGLRAVECERLVRAVEAFGVWDLAHLGPWRPTWFEAAAETEFAGVHIRGRLDRVDRHVETGALRVVEYKRRYSSIWKTSLATQAIRGRKLQPHLYLAAAPAVARRNGAGAKVATGIVFHFVESYLRHTGAVDPHADRRLQQGLSAAEAERVRDGVERTVAIFATMIRNGWFFIRPDEGRGGACTFCQLGTVCRKGYPGLRHKVAPGAVPELRPYWEVVQPRRAKA